MKADVVRHGIKAGRVRSKAGSFLQFIAACLAVELMNGMGAQ